ncbi:MAG TPA: cyclic nucleotide-binding domain-containing protein [Mycobacteriales bacterium]|nr:cyclic nucleotide-binding domain-containing protein [Mycobacteriales bacterium]
MGGVLSRFTDAAAEVPEHYPRDAGGVRRWLDATLADTDPTVGGAVDGLAQYELEALGSALAVLVHSYRWDTMPPLDARFEDQHLDLPAGLADAWRHTTTRLGQQPVGTVYLHSSNWSGRTAGLPPGASYDPRRIDLNDITMSFGWLWGDAAADLEVFALSFVLLEGRAATALEGAVRLIEACQRKDMVETAHALTMLGEGVDDMTSAFLGTIRASRIDPIRWLELVQPQAAWALGGNAGASGLQLGSLRAVDAVLGVDGGGRVGQAYTQMRQFLLPHHRAFLDALDAAAPLVAASKPRWGRLAARRHDECARSLQRLRRAHRARGAQYLRADQKGDSRRVSSGLETVYRDGDAAVVGFEADMQERIDQVALVMAGVGADEVGTPEAAFRFLDEDERLLLLASATASTLQPGDLLVRAGDLPSRLWVVEDGVLAVLTATGERVGRIWPGQVAGEMSLVDPRPASVSLTAEVETQVLAVDHTAVLDLLAENADLARRVYQSLAVAVADKLRARDELVSELLARVTE